MSSGFVMYPPVLEIKGVKNWEHVWPDGGFIVTNSMEEQLISECPTADRYLALHEHMN